ncbi:sigma 54-interacting transcriptional regulator [Mariniflexile gromovii]|uniref:Sigma 54-interacting transcriptional regulator n=1 Tax=Mariniflexile gromovii TaxID=362523 RepID=A0ABS4BZS9_9FLAO|nr:sigma 54-interacting transcriptional regulator [Mariniflexile gromovii]MBP0905680.1 sigma 54-interacting transcriptional regulator [Mariniflexile gromovii]
MDNKTILIVDDIFENLYLLRVILEEAGFNVIEANDGSEGLKKLYEHNGVDLIISDILMPIMDGYLFCQACKKEKLFKSIPFVFYTSTYTDKLDEDFALKLGAAQFLRKPIDHDQLLFTVNDIFNSAKTQVKYLKKVRISGDEVLKLYSERLINKLEQKSLDLGNEVVERQKAEQLLIHKNEILDLIAVNTPLNKIFDKLLLNYESVHPDYFGSISLLDEDGVHLDLVSAPSMPEPYNLAIKRGVIGKNAGSCGTAAFTKKPVIVSDISTDKLWVDYKVVALENNLRSCWSLPIISKNNTVLGTFAIYSKDTNTPSLDEVRELNFAVSLATIAIEKFRIVEEIKKKDESYKSLIDQATDAIITYSLDGIIYNYNKVAYTSLGYTEKEFSKLKIQDFIVGEIIQDQNNLKKLLKGESIIFSRKFIRKDKSVLDVEISAKLQKDGKILGIARDVTSLKKAEIDLKLAKEFTDKLIMSMQEGLLIVNPKAEIMMVNDAFCNMLGYSKEELIGLNLPYPFAKEEDFGEMSKTKDRVATGEAPFFKFEFIRKNGEKFWASFLAGNITNDVGEVIALFGTVKDVSEEERAKKLLEDNAAKSNQKKNVILELASLVGTDYREALKKITKLSAETLDVARVSIWEFNDKKNEIKLEDLFDLNNQDSEKGIILKETNSPNYFEAIFKNKIISIHDAFTNNITDGLKREYLVPLGINSILDVVIQVSNDLYGIVCFEHVGSKRVWSKDDEEFATSIANLVSLMVESSERKLAENEAIKANEQLTKANKELNVLRNKLERENIYLRNELDLVFNYEEMVYGSATFSNVLTEVEKVAPTTATVLLLGESGTGKELLARAIHNISLRNNKPLIKVNCSAIPRELIESELFGHKKGSFTGAFADKTGKFELADGGTLFLDEIGELPIDMQPKILRFLQEGEIETVGGAVIKKLDVRVIAATNRNLKEEVEKKQFREDLYFRLNVFPIEVPPLRKRKDDIPLLVEHFVDKFNKAYSKNIKYISDEAMNQLIGYDWPGNIRELENLIERASILSTNETLLIPGFESKTQNSKISINTKNLSLDAVQRHHILQVLEQCNWKISGPKGAAILLDLKPSTLRDKMAKLNIVKPL